MKKSVFFMSFPVVIIGAAPPQARGETGLSKGLVQFDAVQCESELQHQKM